MNKIQSNCIVKLLPIIDSENEFQWLIAVNKFWLSSSKKFVYEIGGANILRRLCFSFPHTSPQKYLPTHLHEFRQDNRVGKMYLVNILEEGKIKTVSIGKTLMNLIDKNKSLLFDLNSEYHMNVVVEQKDIGGASLPDFDKSSIITKSEWIAPVSNINSSDEWTSWIKANQDNNFLKNIEENSPFKYRKELDMLFDGNFSILIADDRDKKISKILD